MYAISSSVRLRNSFVSPMFQPWASSLSRLLFFIALPSSPLIVVFQANPASLNHLLGYLSGLLAEYLTDNDGIGIGPVDLPPGDITIIDPELMNPGSNTRHGLDGGRDSFSPICSFLSRNPASR